MFHGTLGFRVNSLKDYWPWLAKLRNYTKILGIFKAPEIFMVFLKNVGKILGLLKTILEILVKHWNFLVEIGYSGETV